MIKILVTGGGILAHLLVWNLNSGHEVVVLDHLPNSSEESLNRV